MRILLALFLVGCGDPAPANLCPGTKYPTCLTRTLCEHDQQRGCEVCQCESAGTPPPGSTATQPPDPTR